MITLPLADDGGVREQTPSMNWCQLKALDYRCKGADSSTLVELPVFDLSGVVTMLAAPMSATLRRQSTRGASARLAHFLPLNLSSVGASTLSPARLRLSHSKCWLREWT